MRFVLGSLPRAAAVLVALVGALSVAACAGHAAPVPNGGPGQAQNAAALSVGGPPPPQPQPAAGAPSPGATNPPGSVIVPAQFSALDAYLRSLVPKSEQGLGLIVVRNDKIIYENAYGNIQTNSDILIASASKVFSVTTILTLADRGVLNLDAPVSQYAPSLFPGGTTITMRELISHTSGVNNCGVSVCQPGESVGDVAGAPCMLVPEYDFQSCVQYILSLGSQFAPGTQFDYGGDDYQVAGYIAQVAAGKPFLQLFHDAVAVPCGLSSTTYGDPTKPPPSNPRIGGGVYTTLADYARLLTVHLDHGNCMSTNRVLSDAMVQAMQNDYVSGLPVFYSAYTGHGYGMAWWHVDPVAGNGPIVVHDFGLFGATPWIDNACGYGAFLMLNDKAGAPHGLTIMNYIVNNALITGPLNCPTQSASGT